MGFREKFDVDGGPIEFSSIDNFINLSTMGTEKSHKRVHRW